jgi:hypothetical protein
MHFFSKLNYSHQFHLLKFVNGQPTRLKLHVTDEHPSLLAK